MKFMLPIVILLPLMSVPVTSYGQSCAGAQVLTHEAFKYGRFETRMQSAQGDGIVSAFFLYNVDLECNWPAENNEIDIEMTGNRLSSVQFTTHHPSETNPWSVTHIKPTYFNPHSGMHEFAMEWEPGIVRWFIDRLPVYFQHTNIVDDLVHPMRLMMNLWVANTPSWVGEWDASVMPAQSSYDYVRYYEYTPGAGDSGTNRNFTLSWVDDFTELDANRWDTSELKGFDNNLCTFVSNNVDVDVSAGELHLSITESLATTYAPVTFSVDVSALNLAPTDTIYLTGTFVGWCGSCIAMSDADGDGVWTTTRYLPAGNHEYMFTNNGWAESGPAPLGSSCDFLPCDEYANYGIAVPHGSGPIETDTLCWGTCDLCGNIGIGADSDNDGVKDDVDNCLNAANPQQHDSDADGIGNVCDPDINNDCVVDWTDFRAVIAVYGSKSTSSNWNPHADLAGPNNTGPDGRIDSADLRQLWQMIMMPPGPSAAGCN